MRFPGSKTFNCSAALVIASSVFPAVFGQLSEAAMQQLEARLPPARTGEINFDRDVRPILENRCMQCHGPERPKSHYRLDTRENAVKGGDNGVDIVPGSSAKSPLIYYTARLVEDMEMPPPGKGDPLSVDEVSILRAWIDQGLRWAEGGTNVPPKIQFSVTPSVMWFSVKGNEQKFREHTGYKEGWNGGVQSIHFEEQLPHNRKFTFDGRVFANPEEYKFQLQLEQRDLGYVQMGFEQYREYYSDVGGYYPTFSPSSYALGNDLAMDVGRAWADFVLALPDKPRVRIGYEYQYRNGVKSTLAWGDVGTINPSQNILTTDAKKIYPATKDIDENVHIVKFDVAHEVNGIGMENSFRGEFYDNKTTRDNTLFYNYGTQTREQYVIAKEDHEHFQASDAIRLEKQVLDWLYLSGGYYFSHLDGEYAFDIQTISPIGLYAANDVFWFGDSIVLERTSHVFNLNTQLGSWGGLTLFGGVQGEWMTQHGFGDIRLDEGIPGAIEPEPASVDADLDRQTIEEHFGLRYTAIPYTVLFAEGRLAQESIGQFENQVGGDHEFLRDTDASSHMEEARVGFTISPWTRVSLTSQYRHRNRDFTYDHLRDEQFGIKNDGYSAFITSRNTETDEISVKLTVRPAQWLKTSFTYQKVATDYTTGTDSYIIPELVIPGLPTFPAQVFAPGGSLFAGNYDADIYGVNATFTPWRRLSLSSSFSYRQSRTTTSHEGTDAVVAYDGDVLSSISSATFVVNKNTDLTAAYTYSRGDYGQSNFDTGLPVGVVYDWHIVTAGLSRRFKNNISTTLQYRFYYYDEPNTQGANNYTAHGIFAALTMALK